MTRHYTNGQPAFIKNQNKPRFNSREAEIEAKVEDFFKNIFKRIKSLFR